MLWSGWSTDYVLSVMWRMLFILEELKHWILLVRVLFWNELIVVVKLL